MHRLGVSYNYSELTTWKPTSNRCSLSDMTSVLSHIVRGLTSEINTRHCSFSTSVQRWRNSVSNGVETVAAGSVQEHCRLTVPPGVLPVGPIHCLDLPGFKLTIPPLISLLSEVYSSRVHSVWPGRLKSTWNYPKFAPFLPNSREPYRGTVMSEAWRLADNV